MTTISLSKAEACTKAYQEKQGHDFIDLTSMIAERTISVGAIDLCPRVKLLVRWDWARKEIGYFLIEGF